MKTSFVRMLYALLMIALIITACTPAPAATKNGAVAPTTPADSGKGANSPIYIAAIYPMTGDNAAFGDVEVKGSQYVIDEINAQGGVNGRKVELVVFDDRGDPQEAANIANKVAYDPKFVAGIGHFRSGSTLAAAPIYDAAKFLWLTDSVNEKLTGISPWLFRYALTDKEDSRQFAWAVAKNHPEYKKLAIMYPQNDFGISANRIITEELTNVLKVSVVASESYFEGQSKDFSPQLTKIKGLNPDAIFLCGYYPEGAAIIRQARQLGMNQTFWAGNGNASDKLIELGGDPAEGTRVVAYYSVTMDFPGNKEFATKFQKKYNILPDGFSTPSADMTNMLILGIKTVGTDKNKLKAWLETYKDFVGYSGPIQFNNKHDNARHIFITEIKGGKYIASKDQVPQEYYDSRFGKD